MSYPIGEPRTDWEIGVANFLNFLSVLASPRSPLIWILGGIGVYHAFKSTLCYFFDMWCDEPKDRIESMTCKQVRKSYKSCLEANQIYDTKLAQRGSRITNLEYQLERCKNGRR